MEEHFLQTCRSCMSKDEKLIAISEHTDHSATISESLTAITPQIRVVINDELPQFICAACFKKLNEALVFRKMCIRADLQLRTMLLESETSSIAILSDSAPSSDLVIEQMDVAVGEPSKFGLDNLLKNRVNSSKVNESDQLLRDVSDGDIIGNEPELENQTVRLVHNKTDDAPQQRILCTHNATGMNKSVEQFDSSHRSRRPMGLHSNIRSKKETRNSLQHHRANQPRTPSPSTQFESPRKCAAVGQVIFKCDYCSQGFQQYTDLQMHQKSAHDEEQNFEWNLCHTSFDLTENVNHAKGLQPYACIHCDKAFEQKSGLREHLQTHPNEMTFLCSECGKVFNNSSNLHQHQLRHTGERRYQCPECPSRFACKSDQLKHMTIHRATKPHVCDICGACFTRSYTLVNHKLIHKGERPYKCTECSKSFVFAYHMRRHQKTHSGEKPYKCTYCSCAYAANGDLNKHIRKHIGEKTYKCQQCQETFKYQAELRKHQTHHYKMKQSLEERL